MPNTNPLRCSNSVMSYNGTTILLLDTGNYPGESNFLNQTVTWTHAQNNWTIVTPQANGIDPNGPLPLRSEMGMDLDGGTSGGTASIVLFGGKGQSSTAGVLDDTWIYTSGAWKQETPAVSPPGRYYHEMAVLNGLGTLLFSGCNTQGIFEDCWFWSNSNGVGGGDWQQLTPGTLPPARINFAMAGSTSATNILLFGGCQGANACLGDTWMWVGSTTGNFVQQTPAFSPPALCGASLAFDSVHNQYVLFGGQNSEGLMVPTTYVWTGGNGGNWVQATPASTPPARVNAQMAFDGTNVIMFGGYNTDRSLGDTWAWMGNSNPLLGNWVQQ